MPFLTPETLIRLFLVFARVGGLLAAAPLFGHGSVPVRVRVFLAVLLAYALHGIVPGEVPENATHPAVLLGAVALEALAGAALGYAAQFVFWAVQFAGEAIGFQMGLSMAQVYNPVEGHSANPIGRILSLTFLLFFLLIDGHHHLLRALVASFDVVPLAGARVAAAGPLLLQWVGRLFVTALRLAAPFLVTIFLVDLALGVFARMVPQADLFSLGLPLKLAVGLGIAGVFLSQFVPVVPELVGQMVSDLLALIEAMVPA